MPSQSKYAQAVAARKCVNHPDRPAVHGYKRCQKCLDDRRVKAVESKRLAKERGTCPSHSQILVVDGYTMCNLCLLGKRARHLMKEYGISVEDFAWMELKQDRRCAICEKIPAEGLCVDHDHRTGRVRGLLCYSCNVALGHFEDRPVWLTRAASYLEDNHV